MWSFALTLIGYLLKLSGTSGTQIRVVNGDNSCSGRVEVYHSGQWGTVCDDAWDLKDAEVVCKQLRCGKAVSAPDKAYFGQGSGKIWLDNVGCSGTESSITTCSHRGLGVHDCSASEDAGVVCAVGSNIRLANSSGYCSGRVEVYYSGQWGTVCDDSWSINDAQVVCRQLGCGKAVSAPGSAYFGKGSGTIWLDEVGCSGTESSITTCSHRGLGVHDCSAVEDAGVVCAGMMKTPTLTLHTTNTAVLPGESAEFRCTITSHRPMSANFRLYRNEISTQTAETADQKTVTFSLPSLSSSHQGSYTCDYYYQSALTASSKSNSITITVVSLSSPNIIASSSDITWGQAVQMTCSISTQHLGGMFTLHKVSGSLIETKRTSGMSVTFTIPQADFSHEGSYFCYYQTTVSSRTFTSPQSNTVSISVLVSLPSPHISSFSRDINWGQEVQMTCSISTQHLGGVFSLSKVSGSLIQTKRTSGISATFTIPQADLSHEGSYRCQYQTTVSNRKFTSPQSNTVSISVAVNLHQPRINCTAPDGGLSWGPQGPEITKGHNFSITCSTQPQYPGGVFHLSFSGSNHTMSQPAINHSASFYFPAADYSHQGNYSCVYQVDLSSRQFYSTETDKLTVTIREFMVPFIAAGVTGGVVLLLMLGLVFIFLAKKRQSKTGETSWKYSKGKTKMNTYGNSTSEQNEDQKGEADEEIYLDPNEEDQDDYENVEEEDQDDYENVEMEDQDDYENVELEDQDVDDKGEVEDQDDYENAEDFMDARELNTGCQDEDIYANC
ncbi:leukocyte immunoglobulin-like receptor subfamily B member 3 isoform X1 [Sardina pilchardus]|uniref:leukocyte immunoglobulin-like receptor subfamily B member 3 isoform X1 n=1 Tax=Sardina pilchardus TaxID=27697 RepID=UPI002E0D6B44